MIAACAVAIMVAGCSDEPTRPSSPTPSATAHTLGDAERQALTGAFAFARQQALRGLVERDAADRVAAAFADVSTRVDAGDRPGAERALAAARAAIQQYRRHTADDRSSDADLEALMLTLDHATAIVRESAASITATTSTTPNLER
jgi:hypothetical protein